MRLVAASEAGASHSKQVPLFPKSEKNRSFQILGSTVTASQAQCSGFVDAQVRFERPVRFETPFVQR